MFLIILICFNVAAMSCLQNRPVIGILTQEIPQQYQKYAVKSTSYIVASYVKFVESAGAQVVPIWYGFCC